MENKKEMKSFHLTGYYKTRQSVVTIYDSSDFATACYDNLQRVCYYNSRHLLLHFTTGITIHDKCSYNSRQVLQYTTSVITIHDRYYNSRHYYISRQHKRATKRFLTF